MWLGIWSNNRACYRVSCWFVRSAHTTVNIVHEGEQVGSTNILILSGSDDFKWATDQGNHQCQGLSLEPVL